jgi:hypothetical protein
MQSKDPYFDPEHRSRKTGSTKVDGEINNVKFSLTGPPDTVKSIVTYIRNLTNLITSKHV